MGWARRGLSRKMVRKELSSSRGLVGISSQSAKQVFRSMRERRGENLRPGTKSHRWAWLRKRGECHQYPSSQTLLMKGILNIKRKVSPRRKGYIGTKNTYKKTPTSYLSLPAHQTLILWNQGFSVPIHFKIPGQQSDHYLLVYDSLPSVRCSMQPGLKEWEERKPLSSTLAFFLLQKSPVSFPLDLTTLSAWTQMSMFALWILVFRPHGK